MLTPWVGRTGAVFVLLSLAAWAGAVTSLAQSEGSSGAKASGGTSDRARIEKHADSVFKSNDKNKDGKLQADEWGTGITGRKIKASEAIGDQVVTRDELVEILGGGGESKAKLAVEPASKDSQVPTGAPRDVAHGSPSSEDGGDAKSSSPGESTTSESAKANGPETQNGASSAAGKAAPSRPKRKSSRFRTPRERLPAGLPGWFLESDANRDGQVAMSEYSRAWSNAKAAEFARIDRNKDGIITPKECLKAAR